MATGAKIGQRGLDPTATSGTPGGDGGGNDCGLCYWCGARRHSPGDDGGLRDRGADDSASSHTCWSKWHVRLLLVSRVPRLPQWQRGSLGWGFARWRSADPQHGERPTRTALTERADVKACSHASQPVAESVAGPGGRVAVAWTHFAGCHFPRCRRGPRAKTRGGRRPAVPQRCRPRSPRADRTHRPARRGGAAAVRHRRHHPSRVRSPQGSGPQLAGPMGRDNAPHHRGRASTRRPGREDER